MNIHRNILILTAILLLNSLCCTAFYSGETSEIFNITTCYNTAQIKVNTIHNQTLSQYSLDGCTTDDNILWECECNGSAKSFILHTSSEVNDEFDFVVQYYTQPLLPVVPRNDSLPTANEIENSNYKRVVNHNNIRVGPKPRDPIQMTTGNMILLVVVIGGGLLLFIGIIILIGIWLFKEPKEEERRRPQQQTTQDETTDDDVNAFLKSLEK